MKTRYRLLIMFLVVLTGVLLGLPNTNGTAAMYIIIGASIIWIFSDNNDDNPPTNTSNTNEDEFIKHTYLIK